MQLASFIDCIISEHYTYDKLQQLQQLIYEDLTNVRNEIVCRFIYFSLKNTLLLLLFQAARQLRNMNPNDWLDSIQPTSIVPSVLSRIAQITTRFNNATNPNEEQKLVRPFSVLFL